MTFFLGASFLLALLSALGLTWGVRKLAIARGWNGPLSAHHVHDGPVPRVGGIAVFCALLVALAGSAAFFRNVTLATALTVAEVLAAAAVVFVVGLYDDFHPITAWMKLGLESIAAIALFMAGIRIDHLPILGPVPSLLSLPLTVLCVVGITNAFNLIDGLDGLAAGTATVSAATFLALALHRGDIVVGWVSAALLGAIAGFLRFNLNPASIFLGDCGSLLIGFLISMCAIVSVRETRQAEMIAVPVLAIGLPVMDTLLAILRRYLKGQPIFVPDREHIHHKLLERGHSHRAAVLILYCVSALFGCLSLALLVWNVFAPVMLVLCCATSMVVVYLGYHKSLRLARPVPQRIQRETARANRAIFQLATARLNHLQTFPELWRTLDGLFSNGHFSGYDLCIPAPVAGMDLRDWGFLLDDSGAQYMRHHYSGNGNGGNGHGNAYRSNGHGGNGNGAGPEFITVTLPARKKQPGHVLTVYLAKRTEASNDQIPASFSGALSDAVVRILATLRQQYGPASAEFDSRSLGRFSAEHSSASGSAD